MDENTRFFVSVQLMEEILHQLIYKQLCKRYDIYYHQLVRLISFINRRSQMTQSFKDFLDFGCLLKVKLFALSGIDTLRMEILGRPSNRFWVLKKVSSCPKTNSKIQYFPMIFSLGFVTNMDFNENRVTISIHFLFHLLVSSLKSVILFCLENHQKKFVLPSQGV